MNEGSFDDFLTALLAFESGWDRARYEAGVIADWQLDQWAGGAVETFFPRYSSWGQLTDAEWETMAYRSMNTLGFVGYQFGEALLIDLGYYDDDVFYGNGAAANTWDGSWTGKNGATSLEAFMTAEVQDQAILDAFGYNLQVIEQGLAGQGLSLDDFVGTTGSYTQNGETVTVELTLTGILAAAHLRGAWGTLALLRGGAVSTDEFGTSILQYIEQFGGYDSPDAQALIAAYEAGKTGDEGLGTPGGTTDGGTGGTGDGPGAAPAPGGDGDLGTAGVTAATADVVIDWAWGSDTVVADFDPAGSTIFVSWIGAAALEVAETAAGVVIAVPSNNQSTTLAGITLSDLSPANFTFLDRSAAAEVLALLGGDAPPDDGTGGDAGAPDGEGSAPADGSGGGAGHGGDGGGAGHGGDGGDGGHRMVVVDLASPSTTVADFDPATDGIHIEAGVTGERFEIFEESGDALGQTVRIVVTDAAGAILSTTILLDLALSDLALGNFSIAEQSTLNEVAAALGSSIAAPGETGGYPVIYDADGSAPPAITGDTAAGGLRYRADVNADDIVGFDPARDALDFGGTSVHGLILTKTPAGEIAIDSPWSDAVQIVQGIGFQDVTIESFGVVGNEHLRQDIGGVVSWELGIGPREAGTVYIRSHEYGASEVIDGFDPSTDKISFLYFGTRERLSVEDTTEGLVISSLPTGQSFTFTGVQRADLSPGLVEFHFDQVMEDNLEVPFGFDQNDVTLVDRTVLLTPAAPEGETTDGFQVREGALPPAGGDDPAAPGGDDGTGTGTPPADPDTGGDGAGDGGDGGAGDGEDDAPTVVAITWAWASEEVIAGFDPSVDRIDLGNMGAGQFAVSAAGDGDLVLEVLNNGGQTYRFDGVTAADVDGDTFTAPAWNGAAIAAALADLDALV